MGELELLAAIAKGMSRSKAYKFSKRGHIPEYKTVPGSSKKARLNVARYFELRPEHIVHHKDYDNTNHDLKNLAVFENSGKHKRHHEFFKSDPIWDGEKEE
jgi:hypothetical protein